MRPNVIIAGTLAVALLLAATPVAADILVLEDGSRVETKGPWEVRGQLVVFHLPQGALSSLRLDVVDLEASRVATEEASKPKPEPQTEKAKRSVVVLTDADIGHVQPEAPYSEADEASDQPDEETTGIEPSATGLRVTSWEEVIPLSQAGTTIQGTLSNTSASLMTGIRVEVVLLTAENEILGQRTATIGTVTLRPGETTEFSADLPDVMSFDEVRFDVASIPLQYSGAGTEPEEASDDEEPDS